MRSWPNWPRPCKSAASCTCRVTPPSPGFLQAATQQFALSQDRLHRGLLAKIYATIAEADGRWTYEEQRCVTALLQHVGVSWTPDQLEETARKVARQAAKLEWQRLLQPFRAVPELCARMADLETVVVRVANLIAKADGLVAAKETAVLHAIQEEFRSERRGTAVAPPRLASEANLPAETVPAPWDREAAPREAKRVKVDRGVLREQSLRKLDALVGLRHVKQEIRALADWAFLQSQRRQAELALRTDGYAVPFCGPAGTGKTQVARLLSEILAASGVLKRGQLVEANGFDLVSREPGDAAQVIKAKLREAIGGTLLIEYAGALFSAGESSTARRAARPAAEPGRSRRPPGGGLGGSLRSLAGPVGPERGDWQPMFRRYWRFDDYRAGELGQIFQCYCNRSQYQVTRLAQIKMLLGFDWQLRQDAERFGYGHGVQRVFRAGGASTGRPHRRHFAADETAADDLPRRRHRLRRRTRGCSAIWPTPGARSPSAVPAVRASTSSARSSWASASSVRVANTVSCVPGGNRGIKVSVRIMRAPCRASLFNGKPKATAWQLRKTPSPSACR